MNKTRVEMAPIVSLSETDGLTSIKQILDTTADDPISAHDSTRYEELIRVRSHPPDRRADDIAEEEALCQ